MSVGVVNKSTGDRIPTAGMPAIDAALSGSSTNPVQNRVVKAAFDAIKDGQSIDSFADVETALGEKADTDIVASDFSTSASYTAGNYCIYEGKMYKFKASHSGAWSASDVDEIKIAGELSSLMSGLTSVDSNLNGIMSIIHTATYGRTETPINIDTLGDDKPYMYLVEESSGFIGSSPATVLGGGTTFLLIGIGNAPTQPYGWGAQIAFSFASATIAIRIANYNAGAWNAWNIINSSTPT